MVVGLGYTPYTTEKEFDMYSAHHSIASLILLTTFIVSGHSYGDETSARFDRDIRKKGCELLTAELVSATFDIPVSELKQTKVLGCLYTWKIDAKEVKAHLSMIRAHKSENRAIKWFGNATKDKSEAEAEAEMATLRENIKKSDKIDAKVNAKQIDSILSMVSVKAVSFEQIDGIGDEARASEDGAIYVRVSNLTFNVSAYKGASEPKIDFKGLNLKQVTEASKKHGADWSQKTAPQRKMNSIALAKVILAELGRF